MASQENLERRKPLNEEATALIDGLKELHENSRKRLKESKEKDGRKIIGYFCWYTPKEVISASGAQPIMVCPSSDAIKISGAHVPHFACNTCRSALDQAMGHAYDYLDGLVGCKIDDPWKTCYDVWERHVPHSYTHFVQMPSSTTADGAGKFYIKELSLFKASLEQYMDRKISDEDLLSSIQTSNATRAIIRQLYEMRKGKQPPISGTEMLQVLEPGFSMPLDSYNDMLSRLVKALPQRSDRPAGEVRLMAIASLCSPHIIEILEEIESRDAVVVADTTCIGLTNVISDIPQDGDPLSNIADFYLKASACPAKVPTGRWFEGTLKTAKEYDVQGAVFIVDKYCDPFAFIYPDLRDKFKERGIPFLKIDTGEGYFPLAQVRTRIEAFLEMVKGNV